MLHIHFGNRIERLADVLAENLAAAPPAAPLAAETIVIGRAGMDEWLKRALAARLGIAANLDFPQPARFVWRMLRARDRALPPDSALDRGPLVWRLYAGFGEARRPEEVARYLRAGDELARFELANELATVFEQYQIYRPEWVLGWERGEAVADAAWQAALWRRLAQGAAPNPARLFDDFVQHADAVPQEALAARVSVFGLSAMAPAYLRLFAALARTREVRFYVPNPSREYWGDVESEAWLGRWRLEHPERVEHATSGHPLLSALGKQNRDFIELLNGVEGEVVTEEHFVEPEGKSLLDRLQADMLALREPRAEAPGAHDDSVLVHVCYSRRREVEVLHDALLAAFEADPALGPEDILVMAPNMDDYADHIAAVFGAAPPARHIPWSLAERSMRAEHPLAEGLLTLLALPDSRLKASEVLGLLDLPAAARRYELDGAALENIHRWVAEAGARWAWDGAHRREFDLPAEALFSWRFGLDRLLAGYALAPEEAALWEGIAPYGALEGHAAEALGALWAFVSRLNAWRATLAAPRPLADWVAAIRDLLALFAPETPDELAAVAMLRDAASELDGEREAAGFETEVSREVARAAFAGRLAVPHHPRPFLSGRVTFCALAPLRSIPAKLVWLLGMAEADFPRRGRSPGFDLIAAHPRRGDRARHTEDRELFLEALLGARAAFHASYVGRSERDNEALPASVVVNALLDVIERMGAARESRVIEHYLQPFSARYQASPRRTASYAEDWLGAPGAEPGEAIFATELADEEDAADRHDIVLGELIAGLANPARRYLEALGMARLRGPNVVEDAEPFRLDGLGQWQVADALLARWLAAGPEFEPEGCYPDFLARGWLPPGEAGRTAFEDCVAEARSVAAAAGERGGWQPAVPRTVELEAGRWHLHGVIADYRPEAGLVRARVGKLRAADRLALWVEHLALCAEAGAPPATSSFHAGDAALHLKPVGDAGARLERLCELYAESARTPLPLLPDLSFDYAEQVDRGKPDALASARNRWRKWTERAPHTRIRDAEEFAFVFRGVAEPLGEDFARLAREVFGAIATQGSTQ